MENTDKEFNAKIKKHLASINNWAKELRLYLKEERRDYKVKQIKNASDAIYTHSVKVCDLISDYSKTLPNEK